MGIQADLPRPLKGFRVDNGRVVLSRSDAGRLVLNHDRAALRLLDIIGILPRRERSTFPRGAASGAVVLGPLDGRLLGGCTGMDGAV